MRLDKWLWAARSFKTRALAAEAADLGHVLVNDHVAKASREVRVGDVIAVRHAGQVRTVVVRGLSALRGPAVVAQALYEEPARSRADRVQAAHARRLAPEPGAARAQGRPTKRERRELDRAGHAWRRWSASIDDR